MFSKDLTIFSSHSINVRKNVSTRNFEDILHLISKGTLKSICSQLNIISCCDVFLATRISRLGTIAQKDYHQIVQYTVSWPGKRRKARSVWRVYKARDKDGKLRKSTVR